ncbi:hypothetical protein [Lactobacillus sp. ESL0681]|uniref:hypothetical protein n=1 Tax=Lactobacillus sp. ESL0681 TaxID=2983211 RepID=UPI0023F7B6D1|nr:hypothetical protein [Lactobacillus sp. ESL0681]WEV39981.1 hypothetical protein OZX59_07155 [Lactobacillus sp. ESL0681]
MLDHDSPQYDANGNIQPNATVKAGFKFYPTSSPIKTINGQQFIGFDKVYVPLSEVKPVYSAATTSNKPSVANINTVANTSEIENGQAPVKVPTATISKTKTKKKKTKKHHVKTGNKYGWIKGTWLFPKSWSGYWGGHEAAGNSGIPINVPLGTSGAGNCSFAVYGYVKGTHKYPWQMSKN